MPVLFNGGFGADVNRADIAREYSYMRRVTAMVSAAAVVLWAVTAFAQGAAAFSGKWTVEAPAGAAAGGGGGGGGQRGAGGGGGGRGGAGGGAGFNCGMTCDIVATATSIKVTRAGQGEGATPIVWNCTLDGKDCTNETPGRGGAAPTQAVSSAKLDGNKIVITRKLDMNGTSITATQTLEIVGGKLTVTTTSTMEGAQPRTQTYTKG